MFSWFYPPYLSAGASRVGQLTKYLVRAGVRVSVVTGRPNDLAPLSDISAPAEMHYASDFDLNALPRRFLGKRSVVRHGYELSRLGPAQPLGMAFKQLVHFPDAQAGWIVPAARTAARLDRPDVVLSSSPPASAHLAAALFARRHGIPWVAEYRSPWTDSFHFRRWWPMRPLERALERRVGRLASNVTAISVHLQRTLERTLRRPVEHIPNGYDPEDFIGRVVVEPGLFVHLGSVYAPYPTQILLDALPLVRRSVRVVFLGRNLAGLPGQIHAAGADRLIERPGPVRRSEALALVRRAEANLVFVTEGPGSPGYTDVPQKFYEYLAAGRPVLAIGPENSETADLLRSSGIATFANTPAEVADGLESVTQRTPNEELLAHYSYERIAERFAEVLRAAR